MFCCVGWFGSYMWYQSNKTVCCWNCVGLPKMVLFYLLESVRITKFHMIKGALLKHIAAPDHVVALL